MGRHYYPLCVIVPVTLAGVNRGLSTVTESGPIVPKIFTFKESFNKVPFTAREVVGLFSINKGLLELIKFMLRESFV